MALFELDLTPLDAVPPWGSGLSWFALTEGTFRMPLGPATLFEYSPEILAHWGLTGAFARYQVAAFARDILPAAAAGLAPLPEFFERLTADEARFATLCRVAREHADDEDAYTALRWLGERSPWTSYLTADPRFSFLRLGDEIRLRWDNEHCVVDDIAVWTARRGEVGLPTAELAAECAAFAGRLLGEMANRLDRLASGQATTQVPVDVAALRQQHETWRRELTGYLGHVKEPDVPWAEAEAAIARLLART